MRREYPDRPIVGVGAIVIDGDADARRIILVKRGRAPLLGEWSIPGGVLELGETLRQTAEREALEETGLVVVASELLGVFDRIVADEAGQHQYHYVLIDFLCEVISGELQAAGDAADAQWFTANEVGILPLAEDTAAVIRLGFEKARDSRR
jgi:ADP-ribose pyrophosphatase YjhB (NUDIX family)